MLLGRSGVAQYSMEALRHVCAWVEEDPEQIFEGFRTLTLRTSSTGSDRSGLNTWLEQQQNTAMHAMHDSILL